MNVRSYFVMVLKLYIFSAGTPSRWRCGFAWQVATLPMSYYIVFFISREGIQPVYHQAVYHGIFTVLYSLSVFYAVL